MAKSLTSSKPATPASPKKALAKPTHSVAVVPDASYAAEYINRRFSDGTTDFDVFDYALKKQKPVLIEGPTGPGKTFGTYAWASARKMALASVPSNIGIEPSQLFGKYVPTEKVGVFKWVDGPVTHVVRHGGVLLLNEVNFIPDRVGTVLFGLLDRRRSITLLDHEGEVIKAHKDLLIVADMNPDYEGTRPLNKAFRNRFQIQMFWDYDRKIESKLVKSKSLLDMATNIRARFDKHEFETPLSTNMLREFEEHLVDMGAAFAATTFIQHFQQDEQHPIKVVVNSYLQSIEDDLTPKTRKGEDVDDEDDDYDPDWELRDVPDFTDDDGKVWRKGDVDPDTGQVYGRDFKFTYEEVDDEDEDGE